MPHDRNGKLIEINDVIFIPCIVKSITPDENYCNLTVETLYSMPLDDDQKSIYSLNSEQVVKE